MKIARVAIDVPADTLFDYLAEDASAADIGRPAVVPFGKKNVVGVIVEVVSQSDVPPGRLRRIGAIRRDAPALSAADLSLLKFAAAYYRHPLGMTVMNTLPAVVRRVKQPQERGCFVLTARGAALSLEAIPARARVQRRLLHILKHGLDASRATDISQSVPSILRRWIARGWVVEVTPTPDTPRSAAHLTASAPALTEEQANAVDAICHHLQHFAAFLLFGVTGSGKTEVYLHCMDTVLRGSGQVLLLVPEIALTPQLEATLRARFPATPVTTVHSGLNETERIAAWRDAHAGRARIVLGTRLGVFTPMPNLALVIVDEEHDASLKQSDGFRYSARDLAVVRARQRGVPVVLGSATPALESYHNALSGRYRLLALHQRINRGVPHIECIATRGERLADGLSGRLLNAVARCLERKEQSLVFINRRGYAPVLLCGACGWLSRCHRCTANLVLHQAAQQLRCHHCGHHGAIPRSCPECGGQELRPLGHGTQRVEKALQVRFSLARILRIDRDSTRRKFAWPDMRRQIENGEVDILVGTQILAKGHDFPNLNLVVVLNADSLLYNTDIRASERLYALLTQVAGRAGRGSAAGQVLIQTDYPDHPLYRALQEQDYAGFARTLLEERRLAGFPPYVYQALLRAEAASMESALGFLADAVRAGRALSPKVQIYDPVPATLARVAGRERAQLLVQSASRRRLQDFLAAWQKALAQERSNRARWSLDVDPLEF
ncbi:MAG: primosomal protein N' [Betaproteobacteria bacterium]